MSGASDHIEYDGPRFAMIPEWLLFDPTISMSAKAVYGVLVRHGSNPSNCFPSTARIAALLGTTNKTVRKLVDELVEHGVVERHARYNDNGGFTSNGYVVRGRETPPERRVVETTGGEPPLGNPEPPLVPTEPTPWVERDQPLVPTEPTPWVERDQPLVPTEPTPWVERDQPLVPTEPLKENHLTRAKTTRKHSRVDSRENGQTALIEVDGLTPAASPTIGFDEFWERYPRKVGKEAARKAWAKLIKAKTDPQTIMDRLDIWLEFWDVPRQGVQYVKHPQGWMNSGLYLDDPRIGRSAPKRSRTPVASSRRFSTVIEGDF